MSKQPNVLQRVLHRIVPPRPTTRGFLQRPPFTRPTRVDWATQTAKDAGRRTGETVKSAWMDAAHATVRGAHAADGATAEAGAKLKAAARAALASARFGKPKASPSKPRILFGGKPTAPNPGHHRKGSKPAPVGVSFGAIEASALFVLAGAILLWPRVGRTSPLTSVRSALERAVGHPLGAPIGGPAAAEQLEPGRGRDAPSPLAIPAKGWKDVLLRTWNESNVDQIPAVAGSVTFFGLLALFPAIAAFVSLYGLFFDVTKAREQLRLLSGFLPHDILQFVGDEMVRIASGHQSSLGVAFVVSLLVSLWSANGAVKALIYGLNVAYEERERRNLVVLNLTSLAFTLGAIVFAIVAVAAVVIVPVALNSFGLTLSLGSGGAWIAQLRWPVMLVVLILGLSSLYRYGPSRQHSRWRWITVGGVAAGVLWVAASLLFSWYVSNFAHYDRTYGSLGAVVGFMFWLWYSTIIVLLGAELNAELEHQTAVDTTTGDPRPPGERGARMADTLGRVPGA